MKSRMKAESRNGDFGRVRSDVSVNFMVGEWVEASDGNIAIETDLSSYLKRPLKRDRSRHDKEQKGKSQY